MAYGRVCCQESLDYKAKCQAYQVLSVGLTRRQHRVDENLGQEHTENSGPDLWELISGQLDQTSGPPVIPGCGRPWEQTT